MNKTMKTIKVLWNGKKLRDIYPYATGFQVFKWRLMRLIRKLAIGFSIASLVLIGGAVARYTWPVTVYSVTEKPVAVDNLGPKVQELKHEVLNKLRACESGGANSETGLIVFDSNNKASIGSYQFQKATVVHYAKLLNNKQISGKEAVMIALDEDR